MNGESTFRLFSDLPSKRARIVTEQVTKLNAVDSTTLLFGVDNAPLKILWSSHSINRSLAFLSILLRVVLTD